MFLISICYSLILIPTPACPTEAGNAKHYSTNVNIYCLMLRCYSEAIIIWKCIKRFEIFRINLDFVP